MLRAWRIVKRRYLEQAFSGEGARLYGGRWNSPGRSAVYVSESRALATLEVLAGLQSTGPIPAYMLIGVEFAESLVMQIPEGDLPEGWDGAPPTSVSQAIGDAWLDASTSAVLRVPSAVVSGECNYILNPQHNDFSKMRVGQPETLLLDPRILPS